MSELPDHEPTGVDAVDRVLAEVTALAEAPVAEARPDASGDHRGD
jgi:hypothetical protein